MDRVPLATEMLPTAQADLDLTAILAAMAVVNASVDVHLLKVAPALNPALTWASLTEADYVGYAAKAATVASFTVKQTEADGSRRVQSTTLMSWLGAAGGPPTTFYGVAITEAGGTTHVYRVYLFTAPVTLTDNTQVFNYVPTITQKAGTGPAS